MHVQFCLEGNRSAVPSPRESSCNPGGNLDLSGLIAANAGNDAGGILTYASARSQFGYRTLFLTVLITRSAGDRPGNVLAVGRLHGQGPRRPSARAVLGAEQFPCPHIVSNRQCRPYRQRVRRGRGGVPDPRGVPIYLCPRGARPCGRACRPPTVRYRVAGCVVARRIGVPLSTSYAVADAIG